MMASAEMMLTLRKAEMPSALPVAVAVMIGARAITSRLSASRSTPSPTYARTTPEIVAVGSSTLTATASPPARESGVEVAVMLASAVTSTAPLMSITWLAAPVGLVPTGAPIHAATVPVTAASGRMPAALAPIERPPANVFDVAVITTGSAVSGLPERTARLPASIETPSRT